jgi:hypothetical protein
MNSVGRADQSLEAAREAVGLYEELAATAAAEHAKHLGDALGFMAALLGDAGRRDEAEALSAEVLTRFAETPDGFGPIFVVRGDWHISHGDMRAAIDDLDAAMRAAENAGDRSTRGRVRVPSLLSRTGQLVLRPRMGGPATGTAAGVALVPH